MTPDERRKKNEKYNSCDSCDCGHWSCFDVREKDAEIERLKKRVEELEKENEVLREQNSLYHAKFKELEIAYRRAKRKILKSRAEEAEKKGLQKAKEFYDRATMLSPNGWIYFMNLEESMKQFLICPQHNFKACSCSMLTGIKQDIEKSLKEAEKKGGLWGG